MTSSLDPELLELLKRGVIALEKIAAQERASNAQRAGGQATAEADRRSLEFLEAIYGIFAAEPFLSNDIAKRTTWQTAEAKTLRAAVTAIVDEGSARAIGKALAKLAELDRVGAFKVERLGTVQRVGLRWKVSKFHN